MLTDTQRAALSAAPRTADAPPRLADGVELIGEACGSGFREPPYLARRPDGQVLQLTRLLHLVASELDGRRSYDDIAQAASSAYGRRVSADNVRTLVADKLRPLGLVTEPDGSQPQVTKADPLLGLSLRRGVVPARLVRAITTVCYPLFFPPVVVVAVLGVAAMDWWLFVEHGIAQSVRETVLNPMVFLGVLAAVIVSAAFHECGHATGCRYSGAEPGVMGVGLYLVFPAFYTDVTDAYRLGKAGRLRTDLGGIYFNGLFMLATFGAYLATGFEPLLFLIVVQHIEVAHQLLPLVRLDGYYIVADAVGVPDLFARIGPILRSLVPGRSADPKVRALKPWVRVFVSAWVLVVVPFLLLNLVVLLVHLPRVFATGAESLGRQWQAISAALDRGDLVPLAGGVVQVVALALPTIGVVYTLARVGTRTGRRAWTWSAGRPVRRASVLSGGALLLGLLGWAWLPDGERYRPIQPGERGTILSGYTSFASVVTGSAPAADSTTTDPADPRAPQQGVTPEPLGTPTSEPDRTDPVQPAPLPSPGSTTTTEPSPSPAAETSATPSPETTP